MIALRRAAAALAVLFGIVAPATPTATPWNATPASTSQLQVAPRLVVGNLFERANRSEIRTPLHAAETQKVPTDSAELESWRAVRLGPLQHDRPYDPYYDAPHTQAGAEQFAAALPWPWPGIIHCESLRDESWRESSGSWARGLFQFLPSTWRSLGGYGDPAAASWRDQYKMAIKLRIRDGLRSWDCARILGYV